MRGSLCVCVCVCVCLFNFWSTDMLQPNFFCSCIYLINLYSLFMVLCNYFLFFERFYGRCCRCCWFVVWGWFVCVRFVEFLEYYHEAIEFCCSCIYLIHLFTHFVLFCVIIFCFSNDFMLSWLWTSVETSVEAVPVTPVHLCRIQYLIDYIQWVHL